MPGHLRLPRGTAVAGLAGYGEGGWWVQDIAASLPARLLGAGRGPHRARSLRRAGRQDHAARRRRLAGDRASTSRKVVWRDFRENLARTGLAAEIVAADVMTWRRRRRSTRSCSTRPARRPASSAAIPTCSTASGRAAIAELAEAQKAMLARAADWLKPGGTPRLFGLLARAGGGRGGRRRTSSPAPHGDLSACERARSRILPGAYAEAGRRRQLLHRPLQRD